MTINPQDQFRVYLRENGQNFINIKGSIKDEENGEYHDIYQRFYLVFAGALRGTKLKNKTTISNVDGFITFNKNTFEEEGVKKNVYLYKIMVKSFNVVEEGEEGFVKERAAKKETPTQPEAPETSNPDYIFSGQLPF
jgi:hypothetical protein